MNPIIDNSMLLHNKAIIILRKKIISWYNKNKRDYPWRRTRNPFMVLIAELMLRRTKADQVKPVYEQLCIQYPDINALADANNNKLEKILYPLGLKWRNSAFNSIAKDLREKYNSRVPDTRKELTALPGVGDYVAGAVLSFAYNKNEWIVDSNIVRLFKRYFGIKTSKEGRRDKHVIETARLYASGRNPRKANLAILDFTALICRPRNPNCEICPVMRNCYFVNIEKSHKIQGG